VPVVHLTQAKEEVVLVDPNVELQDNVTGPRSGRDADEAKFHAGQKVKLLEDIVNDGTYPHTPIGTLMMPKDSIGYIKTMGDFLQVIRVYEVHFFGTQMPVDAVGCREHELEAMEDYVDEVAEEFAIMKAHRERMQKQREERD